MIGERIKLAREAMCLTQKQLAFEAGIAQGTLSDIEAGRVVTPSESTIASVARVTQFPISFFKLGPLPDLPEGRFRRLARGTSKRAKQLRAQVRQIVEVVERAEESSAVRLPRVTIEPVTDLDGLDSIESVAAQVRHLLGLGVNDPIPNVMRAIERAGVVVVRLPGDLKDHDGFSAWPEFSLDGRPIIALTDGHPGDRDRFSIAHELGHLVLHTARPSVEPAQAEIEANRFAGALLLSKTAARESLRQPLTLRVLMDVKATYGISMAAAARRALDLNLITKQQYLSIQKQLSARGWRKDEPVEVARERPLLIAKTLAAFGGEGSTMLRAERLAMPPFTLRSIEVA